MLTHSFLLLPINVDSVRATAPYWDICVHSFLELAFNQLLFSFTTSPIALLNVYPMLLSMKSKTAVC